MTSLEESKFDLRSKEFYNKISTGEISEEEARELIGKRQSEIVDSPVSNAKKVQALDEVLSAIERTIPQANTTYCQALEKRLEYTCKKNDAELNRIAKDANFHRRGVDFMLYGKIVHTVYKHSKDKKNFPYKTDANIFRQKQLEIENSKEREERIKILSELDFYLEQTPLEASKKLDYIDEILKLTQEKYFGVIKANESNEKYCRMAVSICREELGDENEANYYLGKAKEYSRRAEKAGIEWKRRHGMPTTDLEKAYMYKYRTDKGGRK